MEKEEGSGLKSKTPIFKKNKQKRKRQTTSTIYIYSRLKANKRKKWSWNSMCENGLNGYNNEVMRERERMIEKN